VDNDFMTIPKHLYHYTSQKGLLGILDIDSDKPKPRLWMTNIRYLNDSSEFVHSIEIIWSVLNNLIISIPCGNTRDRLETIDQQGLEKFNYFGKYYFVFSLSKIPDDLNQWRGYCPETGGICIEFDNKKLQQLMLKKRQLFKETHVFSKCKYKPNEKTELVRGYINKILPSLESELESDDNITKEFVEHILGTILILSPSLKDESFSKEEEYRIVYECHSENKIKYREGKSMIIPYIEFSLMDDDGKLPISKIWIGPTPHKVLSKLSVKRLLESNGYEIEVENSKIPYRSW
jgi:hypothetical protein